MDATSPLVLVVDDSADARLLYSDYLEHCGFRVVTAANGEGAVRIAHEEWPAAIVMGLGLAVTAIGAGRALAPVIGKRLPGFA